MDRKHDLLTEAVFECLEALYNYSVPSASFKEYNRRFKEKELSEKDKVFEWHYMPDELFKEITQYYKDHYNITAKWGSYCDTMIEYLRDGGRKDVYIEGKDGFPGHRGYEDTPKIEDAFKEILGDDAKAKKCADKCLELMKECKDYYRFDRQDGDFMFNVCMYGPTCGHPEKVEEFWKNKGVDVKIDDKEIINRYRKEVWGEDEDDDLETINEDQEEETTEKE